MKAALRCRTRDPRRPWQRQSWRRALLPAMMIMFVEESLAQSSSRPGQVVIPLYLINATLDSYPPRQGTNTAVSLFSALGIQRSLGTVAAAAGVTGTFDTSAVQLSSIISGRKEYFGVYEVGTPPKQFTGCFDTGSADVWLPLSTCQSQACVTHDTYNPNASTTYQGSNTTFSIQYVTGSVFGNVAQDTFRLGGVNIANQAFWVVQVAGDALYQSSCDGIFGLSFPQISKLKAVPPFYNMVDRSLLTQDSFSFWLSADASQEPAGELVIGGTNPTRFTGPVISLNVPTLTYWALPLSGAVVGAMPLPMTATTAIIDSGGTAITVGASDAAAIHEQIPGTVYWSSMGVYNISGGCADLSNLPTVSFTLGGETFAIPSSLWVIKFMGTCISGFVPSGRASQIVLGVPFLRAWYTQYTYDPVAQTAQIGFAAPRSLAPTVVVSSGIQAFGRRKLIEAPENRGDLQEASVFAASIPSAAERGLQSL